MEEYERATLKQAAARDQVVKLDPKMYKVLCSFAEVFESRTAKAHPGKFNLPPKKRKRHELSEWPELKATVNPQPYAVVQQKKRLLFS